MKFVSLLLAGFLLAADAQLLRRVESNEEKDDGPDRVLLARVELEDDSFAMFEEVGDILLFTSETSGMGEKMLEAALGGDQDEAKALQKIPPVKLFEKLTAEPVPEALRDAQDRMMAKIAEMDVNPPENEDDDDEEEEEDVGVEQGNAMSKTGGSTCSWWQAYQCPYYYGYKGTCYSCFSGTKKTIKWTRDIYLKAYAYSGKIKHRLRYKPCNSCSWCTLKTHTVRQGRFSRIGPWVASSKVKFEGKIYQAGGDIWHWFVSWL